MPHLNVVREHREILEAALHEGEDLVPARLRLDEARGGARRSRAAAACHFESRKKYVGSFTCSTGFLWSGQTLPVLELLLGVERLAADAVPALVLAEVDVAVRRDLLPELLHERLVVGIGGADEAVVVDVELRPRLAEARADLSTNACGAVLLLLAPRARSSGRARRCR